MRALRNIERDLLRYLDEREEWQTSAKLSAHFGVSVRQIKYIVSALNREDRLVLSSRLGYRTDPERRDIVHELLQRREEDDWAEAGNREERRSLLLRRLILADGDIDLYELSEELYLNVTTLKQDLLELRPFLSSCRLRLGIAGNRWGVSGEEAARRHAMAKLLAHEAARGFVLRRTMLGMYGGHEAHTIQSVLDRELEAHGYVATDYSRLSVACYLLVAVERVCDGHGLDAPIDVVTPAADEGVCACARDVLGALSREFSCVFGVREEADFALLLQTVVLPTALEHADQLDLESAVGRDTARLVLEIVDRVRDGLHIDLGEGTSLVRFALHLQNLLVRCERGTESFNPIAGYIKVSSPLIYEASVMIADVLSKRTGYRIGDSEIAFLCLHLSMLASDMEMVPSITAVLICPQYHDVATRMAAKLEDGCQGLFVSSIVGNEEELSQVVDGATIIVSTISLSGHYQKETVFVTPLLSERETESVRRAAVRIRKHQDALELEGLAAYLMHESLFDHRRGASSFDAALAEMSEGLCAEGYVDADYIDSVRKREELSPTTFGSVAIPHSLHPMAKCSAVSVLSLEKPVTYAGARVNLILLIAIRPDEQELFSQFFNRAAAILTEGDRAVRLARCASFEEFRNLFLATEGA